MRPPFPVPADVVCGSELGVEPRRERTSASCFRKESPHVHRWTAMQRVGDESAGFTVEVTAPDRVQVRAWGFWSVQVASAFEPTVAEACRRQAKGGTVVLDMGEVKPMREEGQQAVCHLVRALPTLGITRVSIVTTNPLTKLQLVRLVTESRTSATIEWVAGATNQARSL
jgi:hypothetical protein